MKQLELYSDISNQDFDKLYPEYIRSLSNIHWTPIEIIEVAIEWLGAYSGANILDIGSGAGKFCIVGGILSNSKFTGIEKRGNLVSEANKLLKNFELNNVRFINANILNSDFRKYDAFYYFNPFCEQIASCQWIDQNISFSKTKYRLYENYVYSQLLKMPLGTRLVTYCSHDFSPPSSYKIKEMMFNGLLVLWIKKTF
ncbi:MAG: methyltransferase domain-containing protein [Flavobacteriales bacterium]|nr:methyltransferase domain-containing protein [Flavobacteriales bacterium]